MWIRRSFPIHFSAYPFWHLKQEIPCIKPSVFVKHSHLLLSGNLFCGSFTSWLPLLRTKLLTCSVLCRIKFVLMWQAWSGLRWPLTLINPQQVLESHMYLDASRGLSELNKPRPIIYVLISIYLQGLRIATLIIDYDYYFLPAPTPNERFHQHMRNVQVELCKLLWNEWTNSRSPEDKNYILQQLEHPGTCARFLVNFGSVFNTIIPTNPALLIHPAHCFCLFFLFVFCLSFFLFPMQVHWGRCWNQSQIPWMF